MQRYNKQHRELRQLMKIANYNGQKWLLIFIFCFGFTNVGAAQQDSLRRRATLPKVIFIPTEAQKKHLFDQIMHDTTIRYKQAFYHLSFNYFFREDGMTSGFNDTTKLEIHQSIVTNVFKVGNEYIGVFHDSHWSDIILMSSDFAIKDVICFGESYPPYYECRDIDNDGIKEFIFYEHESGASFISTNPAFMVIVAINKEKGKFEQVLRLPFANFHLDEDRALDLIDEEKTKVAAIGKNKLRATYFLRKKNEKKWKQVKVEIYKKTGKYQYTKFK